MSVDVISNDGSYDSEWSPPPSLPYGQPTAALFWLLYARNQQTVDTTSYSADTLSANQAIFDFFKAGSNHLFEALLELREEIRLQKEHWRSKLTSVGTPALVRVNHASSGVYLMYDQNQDPFFVIKPLDEDIFCLNNPFIPAPPVENFYVRSGIPLYQSAKREVAAYQTAYLLESTLIPRTMLALVSSSQFFDFTETFRDEQWQLFIHEQRIEDKVEQLLASTGLPDKEKMCSVREYVGHATTLYELIWRFEEDGRGEAELLQLIDPDDFEEANIIAWITGNKDNHPGNILAYPKGVNAEGKETYGLKLIDQCLVFPEDNKGLINLLPDLVHNARQLSDSGKLRIATIPTEQIIEQLKILELDRAIPAFLERIEVLQQLAEWGLSLEEINMRMSHLHLGKESVLDRARSFSDTPTISWTKV